MAISSYLRECGYELGGLLPKIYLIHKNALKLAFKAKGIEVSVVSRQDGDIYVLEGSLVQYKQEETNTGKYRFTSALEVTVYEQSCEPFFYGLRTLRTNQYYIIIEDKKGVQYLINPELYTKMTYEYSFGDGDGFINNVVITFNNLSNYPLLIFDGNIKSNKSLLGTYCDYNLGQIRELLLFDHKDLNVKDDGVKASEMFIESKDVIHRIDYLKESISLTEQYDGEIFNTTLIFSIPLDDEYGWAYRLLEYEDNKYSSILLTTNDNYILCGVERGLLPSYSISTSESDDSLNIVQIKFEHKSQYPLLYTNEINQYRWTEGGEMCFGYNRYQMLVKEESKDWGETWVETDVKKKGRLISSDSEECKQYMWEGGYSKCSLESITYIRWIPSGEFICENGNKYSKTVKETSSDGVGWVKTDEYGIGELIQENADECQYIAVRWVPTDEFVCYEVDENYTYTSNESKEHCSGTTLVKGYAEYVSHNGFDYYPSGKYMNYEIIEEKCYACGYAKYQWREDIDEICGFDLPNNVTEVEEAPEINIDFE